MPTPKKPKKTSEKKKSTPIKKTLSTRKKSSSRSSKHIVDAKLNRVMDEQTASTGTKTKSLKSKRSFPWWGLFAFVLLVVFTGILLYENNEDFRLNLNKMLGSVGIPTSDITTEEDVADSSEPFNMKLNIVYNTEDSYMKESIEQYLLNLENNLTNTKVDANWLDKNDDAGKALIEKLDAKYLPLFTTDATIKDHSQYQLFGGAITQEKGEYVFQSEGMEYLQLPTSGDATYLGANPDNAKVVIVEYASFSCGYCKAMHQILNNVLQKYPSDVSLVVKHFDRGGIDTILSQAAECGNDQGKFTEMIDAIYTHQSDFFTALQDPTDVQVAVDTLIATSAREAGLNADTVSTCITEGTHAEMVKNHTLEGREFGVLGTPSFFINKKFLGGATEEATFMQLVEEELNN